MRRLYTTGMAAVSISPRGEARLRHGHPWIYRSDVDAGGAAGGEVVTVRGARDRVLGQAFFSDRSQIALRMLTRDERPVDDAFWRARLEAALQFRASLAHRRHGLPARARRGRPAAVDHRRSLRRRAGRADPVAGLRTAAAGADAAARRAHRRGRRRRAQRSARAPARGPRATGVGRARRGAGTRRGARRVDRVRRRRAGRPEDRPVPRPAREPRGRGRLRARPAARRLQLPRRLRAGARRGVFERRGARRLSRRRRHHPVERR